MKLSLTLALQYLRHSSVRSVVLGGAIAVGCFISILFISFLHGITLNLTDVSAALVGGHVNVVGLYKPHKEKTFYLLQDVEKIKKTLGEEFPDAVSVSERLKTVIRIVSEKDAVRVSNGVGVDIAHDPWLKEVLRLAEQSDYKVGGKPEIVGNIDDLAKPNTIALFRLQAEQLGVDVGDTVFVTGRTIRNVENAVDVKVVAVIRDLGLLSLWYAFLNKETVARLSGVAEGADSQLSVYLPDAIQAPDRAAALRERMSKAGFAPIAPLRVNERSKLAVFDRAPWVGVKQWVSSWQDEIWLSIWVLDVAQVFYLVVLFSIATIIGIGIVNISLIAARERTPQIGILRALGMSRTAVLAQVMIEMLLLTLSAAIIGLALGTLVAHGLNTIGVNVDSDTFVSATMSNTLRFAIDRSMFVLLLGTMTVVSLIGSFLGGLRAVRIEPTTAIRMVD